MGNRPGFDVDNQASAHKHCIIDIQIAHRREREPLMIIKVSVKRLLFLMEMNGAKKRILGNS